MLLTEQFISSLVGIHGQHPVSTEPNALMTIFLAERRIVNYYMCGIG
jgi:hypothetical protein